MRMPAERSDAPRLPNVHARIAYPKNPFFCLDGPDWLHEIKHPPRRPSNGNVKRSWCIEERHESKLLVAQLRPAVSGPEGNAAAYSGRPAAKTTSKKAHKRHAARRGSGLDCLLREIRGSGSLNGA